MFVAIDGQIALKGLITACGFVTAVPLPPKRPRTLLALRGLITACGFVTNISALMSNKFARVLKGLITACGFVTVKLITSIRTFSYMIEKLDYRLRYVKKR